jgi:thiol-disulfide isomerase/thioredoxin
MENLSYILIAIIFILGASIMLVCKSRRSSDKSTFGQSDSPTGKVYIFYAPWCGHCKDSMGKFNDAVTKGKGKIQLIDATDDANEALAEKYGVTGFPTIIKDDGTKYSGDRSTDSILAFAGIM